MGNVTRTPAPAPAASNSTSKASNQVARTPATSGQTTASTVQTNGTIQVTVGAGGQGTTAVPNASKGTVSAAPARAGGTTTVVSDTGQRVAAAGGAGSASVVPPAPAPTKAGTRAAPPPPTPANAGTNKNPGVTARVATSTTKAAAVPPQPIATTANKSAAASRPSAPVAITPKTAAVVQPPQSALRPFDRPTVTVTPLPRIDLGVNAPPPDSPAPPPVQLPPPQPSVSPGNNGSVTVTWDPVYVPPTQPTVQQFDRTVIETIPAQYRTVSEPIYAPTYENQKIKKGGRGGGGGFSYKKIKVQTGDVVTIIVGATGDQWLGGTGPGVAAQYKGGNAGANAKTGGRGGGGGGATVVLVNGVVTAVAGGGGGGSGGTATVEGSPGNSARNTGIGTDKSGGNSGPGLSTGGGGGGGFWGGDAGASGPVSRGGEGGVNLGQITEQGSGVIPGGTKSPVYPQGGIGYSDSNGAVVIDLFKTFALKVKVDESWKDVEATYVKVDDEWKEIYQGWAKVTGTWAPLVSGSLVDAPSYSVSANVSSVNEGQAVAFTLTTANVAAGTVLPWSAIGLNSNDLQAGVLKGNFIVGSSETITFVPRVDWNTTGERTLTVSLDQQLAADSVVVNDTTTSNIAPVITYSISPDRLYVVEGTELTVTVTTINFGSGRLFYTIEGNTSPSQRWQNTFGSVDILNNSGTFKVRSLFSTFGEYREETFRIRLRRNGITGPDVAVTSNIIWADIPQPTIVDPPLPPSYRIVPAASGLSEGSTLTLNVSTSNYGSGTLFWTIEHITTNSADFTASSGTVIVADNEGTFTIQALSDVLDEATERFKVHLRTGGNNGAIVASTSELNLIDTTPSTPTATLRPRSTSMLEGTSLTFNVSTTNIGSGTLYWTIAHGTTNNADFLATTGTVSIASDAGTFNVQALSDAGIESTETFTVQLRTGSISGNILTTSQTISISDTTPTPVTEYSIRANSDLVSEGSSVGMRVTTVNFGSGTLYWSIDPISASVSDFAATSGSVSLTNDSGTFNITVVSDSVINEGDSFRVHLRTDSTTGTIRATSGTIRIVDTSSPPISYTVTYSSLNATSGGEGPGIVLPTPGLVARYVVDPGLTSMTDTIAPQAAATAGAGVTYGLIPTTSIPAAIFTGAANSFVSSPDVDKLALTKTAGTNFTIEAWVYRTGPGVTTAAGYGGEIVNKDSEYEIAVSSAGKVITAIDWGLGSDNNLPGGGWMGTAASGTDSSTAFVPLNTATHVAVVVENTTQRTYINGALAWTRTGLDRKARNDDSQFFIGSRSSKAQNWQGYIGDVRIWNIARSESEIIETLYGIPEIYQAGPLRFRVTTSNFGSGTLYWTIQHETTSSGDFSATSGSVTITNDKGTINVNTIADNLTEGNETFKLELRTGSTSGPVVAITPSVTLPDTSFGNPIYTITPNISSVNEGSSVVFTVNAGQFGSGKLYATVLSENITATDIVGGTMNYAVDIINSTGTFTVQIEADRATEGAASFAMQLREGSSTGKVIAVSSYVTVNDTSLTPSGQVTFIQPGETTWTVPSGVTTIRVEAVGGGGGSGGTDKGGGFDQDNYGRPGTKISGGTLAVTPGEQLKIFVGGGGQGGFAGRASEVGAPNTETVDGKKLFVNSNGGAGYGQGGGGGRIVVSGQGGGGGGGSAVVRGSTPLLVAAGGGGGGGSGSSTAVVSTALEYVADTNGQTAANKTSDGGSGGGGGGGIQGGQAGKARSGDSGAYNGSRGRSFVPTGFTESVGSNGGQGKPSARNTRGASGTAGYVKITWG